MLKIRMTPIEDPEDFNLKDQVLKFLIESESAVRVTNIKKAYGNTDELNAVLKLLLAEGAIENLGGSGRGAAYAAKKDNDNA